MLRETLDNGKQRFGCFGALPRRVADTADGKTGTLQALPQPFTVERHNVLTRADRSPPAAHERRSEFSRPVEQPRADHDRIVARGMYVDRFQSLFPYFV